MQKKVYIESYGCQMNVSDSEVVASILAKDGYTPVQSAEEADLVLLNTCSIREKAEYTVMQRINEMNNLKARNKGLKVGVLGCMAERMREDLLEKKKVVDLVVGPDAYRTLPDLLEKVGTGQKAVNVLLSREETYGEIVPVRLDTNGVTAFVTIMRGCDNMCAFCVVPFTRGRERSRDAHSIVEECRDLVAKGYKEVTLLGQNVDSYKFRSEDQKAMLGEASGTVDPPGRQTESSRSTVDFADLLEMVALACPSLRIRYSTSHPKDMTDKVLEVMSRYDNICKYIHLPVQSGSSAVLAAHEPGLRPGLVPGSHGEHPQAHAGLRHQHGHHRGLLRRDRGGPPGDPEPDPGGGLRHGLHVQVQRAAQDPGGAEVCGRCARGGEGSALGGDDRHPETGQCGRVCAATWVRCTRCFWRV